jgi:hypothetical protein
VSRARNERGAVAILVAALTVVLFGIAALGVDIASQSNRRQTLHDALDTAAHAAAIALPDRSEAEAQALAFADENDTGSTPSVDFYCVVASEPVAGGGTQPNLSQIPGMCDPGSPLPSGTRCDDRICAIPCPPTGTCNSVAVTDERPVDFAFGAAVGVASGSTGVLTSAACKGPCGAVAPSPMDVVVVGDRTPSMEVGSTNHVTGLVAGIEALLEILSPGQHRVALGTIGRSSSTAPMNCLSEPSRGASYWANGPFVPVDFTDGFDDTDVSPPSEEPDLDDSDPLVQAVRCLDDSYSPSGTYLAAPMEAAKDKLMSASARDDAAKVIVFMTDGEPYERPGDPGSGYQWSDEGETACNNAVEEGEKARAAGITVVTIGYRLEGVNCRSYNGGGGSFVTQKLAAMSGTMTAAGVDETGCNDSAEQALENGDNDLFFCAATRSSLERVFRTVAVQLGGGTRLIKLP